MKCKKMIGSPVSRLFVCDDVAPGEITLNLCEFKNKREHIQIAKSCITYAIIMYYRSHHQERLKRINLISGDEQHHFLPLIYNQTRFFDISLLPTEDKESTREKCELRDDWVKQIVKNINSPLSSIKQALSRLNITNSDKLLFYRTVSDNPLQVRFNGYQIGKWNSQKRSFCPVNNSGGPDDFVAWANDLIIQRSTFGHDKYHEKEEHYLESILLEKIANNQLEINNRKIEKIFPQSEVFFQFPVLLKRGASSNKGNSAKYIDILAKSGNRPVVMELKIWNKKSADRKPKNSRGHYMFSAISQALSYCNYLVEIFGNQDKQSEPGLEALYNLDWKKPIIYIVINQIDVKKEDETAIKFRSYIEDVIKHTTNAEVIFIEFEQNAWDKRRAFKITQTVSRTKQGFS